MFTISSALVRLWVKYVMDSESSYTKEQVPRLSNLQEMVYIVLEVEQTT